MFGLGKTTRLRYVAVGLLALAGSITLASCSARQTQAPDEGSLSINGLNVMLISIDTLRADHVGWNGYPRDSTPVLDRLATESVVFKNVFAPAPWTLPSHAGMLTGVHPFHLGIRDNHAGLPDDAPRVADLFRNAGYQTAAFVDSTPRGNVGGERGFAKGFAEYSHAPFNPDSVFKYDMAATTDSALSWIDHRSKASPFFVFLHTYSVHSAPATLGRKSAFTLPYETPEPFRFAFTKEEDLAALSELPVGGTGTKYLMNLNSKMSSGQLPRREITPEQVAALVGLYDAGVRYVDHNIGRLLDGLKERGLYDRTVIVVTSDHGEEFFEYGGFLHTKVRAILLRVPLLFHIPNALQGVVRRDQVQLLDLAPTFAKLLGQEVDPRYTGAPLPFEGPERGDARPLFAFCQYHAHDEEKYAVTEGGWKLVLRRPNDEVPFETKIFDLASDPMEIDPLDTEEPAYRETAARLETVFEREFSAGPRFAEVSSPELDAKTLAHLEALGYVDDPSPASAGPEPGEPGDSAQDF